MSDKTANFYAVDAGNSLTKVAYVQDWNIVKLQQFPATRATIKLTDSAAPVITCSVRSRAIKFKTKSKVLRAGKDIRIPLQTSYNIRQMGTDRLLNSFYASVSGYRPSIIVSVGTALTADFIGKSGRHEGGIITSSPSLSLKALHLFCDKLPLVPTSRIGQLKQPVTKKALQAGTHYLYESMLINLKKQFSGHRLIGTGGGALMYMSLFDLLIPDMTIRAIVKLVQFHGEKALHTA